MDPSESPSCIGVQWEIENPKFGDWFRTPYFRLRESELCLELLLNCSKISYSEFKRIIVIKVLWRRSPPSVNFFYASSYVTAGSKLFSERHPIDKSKDSSSVDTILYQEVQISEYTSIAEEQKWIVFCRLGLNVVFEDQVEKKRIRLTTVDHSLPSSSVEKFIQVSPKFPQDLEALSQDYARLLKEKIFPDFKLSCGGQTFPVHRCVLSARSEVFRAMFSNQMQEGEAGLVVVEDLEVSLLELLLKFVYSGKLEDISVETASKLYEAADKYAVKPLMTACSYYMIGNMTVDNCVSHLKTADSLSDSNMKADIVSFIIRHPAVFKSTAWETFSVQHRELAFEILQAYVASLN